MLQYYLKRLLKAGSIMVKKHNCFPINKYIYIYVYIFTYCLHIKINKCGFFQSTMNISQKKSFYVACSTLGNV